MLRDEENYVALFVDWDNLAISTAVDFGGALPDVRAIVKAAQRSGTILVARAYAEWNATSDRLSVYRAGVEPVYAPTFRFEPEPGSQARGKSLADPCLVTDCIDLLHLMPELTTFVLVSGDKDLIPIVRLVQLRGKRVVVIGPDFVAAILREMADEYIPYRVLAETSDSPPSTEVSSYGPSGPRRNRNGSTGGNRGSAASHAFQRVATPPARPAARLAPAETNGSAIVEVVPPAKIEVGRVEPQRVETSRVETPRVEIPRVEPVIPEPVRPEPAVVEVPQEEQREVGPLFELIASILRDREQAGKPRLRATNLKDQLLARVNGFNERKYGFARFKDLLASAEKAGVLTVSRTGPVQWVTAAQPAAPAPAVTPEVVEVVTEIPATVTDPVEDDLDRNVVRYLLDLRERSRWLTYTYLMTNMINHLGKGTVDADAAVRTTLNRLVQSGVLIVDKEPREIDVNGVKHRVKMCHIVDGHPLVAALRAELATEAVSEMASGEAPPAEAPAEGGDELSPALVPALPVGDAAMSELASESWNEAPVSVTEAAAESPMAEPAAADVEASEVSVTPEAPVGELEARSAVPVAVEPVRSEAGGDGENGHAESAPTNGNASGNGNGSNGNGKGHATVALTLAESYAILREVVREATGPTRPSTGPAAVKNRLVRRLGSFDERAFGFSKFKDYLLAAERAGAVHVEVVGTTARVSLPEEPAPSVPPEETTEGGEAEPRSESASAE